MATLRETFSDIADAIRAKGATGTMTPLEMSTKIENLPEHDPRYEVNQQGGLVKKSYVVDWFDDLTSIPQDGFRYAYYISGVTSASFTNVTSIGNYGLYYAFNGCTSLTSVDLSKLTSIGNYGLRDAFSGCTSLTSVDLSNVTSIGTSGLSNTFNGCTSLTSVDLSNVTSIENYGLQQVFQNCSSLTSVDLSKVTSGGSSGMAGAFSGCSSLKNVYLSSLSSTAATNTTQSTFNGCTSLELVDFSEATAIPAIHYGTFSNTNSTFKIVVPDALYDSWIVATNWSARASQIVKASEYTPAS